MSNNTKFKVGQVWRARDGGGHKITEVNYGPRYPIASACYRWTSDGSYVLGERNPMDLVELIEDAPEQTPVYRDPSTLERLERFALAETLPDYDHPDRTRAYHAVLTRLNGEPPSEKQADWEATGRAKLKVLRAKALLAVLEAEGGEA